MAEEVLAVASGYVADGVDNAACLASQLLEKMWWIRRCAIAIANETEYTLYHPKRYEHAGRVVCMPMQIGPGKTGLIGAYKTAAVAGGTSGVISYEIDGLFSAYRYLQIMWTVPYVGRNWVNVTAGCEPASKELFSALYKGDSGVIRKATETAYTVSLTEDSRSYLLTPTILAAEVYMSAEGHSVLVVQIRTDQLA